jgi:dimethylhistidine N-methyltransferase
MNRQLTNRHPVSPGAGEGPVPISTISDFAIDVRAYLTRTPRQLPSRYFYDPLGSALFDAICRLPWYAITRSETRLIADHARAVFGHLEPLAQIVELGSGNGDKLATLVSAGRQAAEPLEVHLVDVSAAALARSADTLSVFDGVDVFTHQMLYEDGLEKVRHGRSRAGRTLALFLGSNIGNFDQPAAEGLLRRIRVALGPGDAFLLGADLVKPERDLLLAYDDPLGVTAAFNRNLLVRLNRELGADIDLASFEHRAEWHPGHSRVEMHLVSTRPQRVRIPVAGLDFTMNAEEKIWTESSYKYEPADLVAMLTSAGFRRRDQWIDPDARFALTLVDVK